MQTSEKKSWSTPELTVHGGLEVPAQQTRPKKLVLPILYCFPIAQQRRPQICTTKTETLQLANTLRGSMVTLCTEEQ